MTGQASHRMHTKTLSTFAKLLLILSGLSLQGCNPASETTITVVKIIDGDTIIVAQQGEQRELDLQWIDAPEREQPYGREAKAHLAKLILNKAIHLKESGEVWLDDKNINLSMLAAGMAWLAPQMQPVNQQFSYSEAQSDAMNQGVGLWALAHELRIPPWIWREQGKHMSRQKAQRPVFNDINNNR